MQPGNSLLLYSCFLLHCSSAVCVNVFALEEYTDTQTEVKQIAPRIVRKRIGR